MNQIMLAVFTGAFAATALFGIIFSFSMLGRGRAEEGMRIGRWLLVAAVFCGLFMALYASRYARESALSARAAGAGKEEA